VGVADIPLIVTVLVFCDEPKFEPLTVTGVPIAAEVGRKEF
jgi:hypothetical protein